MFEDVVSSYEESFRFGGGLFMNGKLGAVPTDIMFFLTQAGIEYQGCTLKQMKNITERGAMIISYWNKPMTYGIHTIAINFDGENYFAYNYETSRKKPTKVTLESLIYDDWRYIYGFYVPYS